MSGENNVYSDIAFLPYKCNYIINIYGRNSIYEINAGNPGSGHNNKKRNENHC